MIPLPQKFLERIQKDLSTEANLLADALLKQAIISVRCNPIKSFKHSWNQPIPWCNTGYYLNTRPIFTLDPLYHAGAYYSQEASSMIIDYLFDLFFHPNDTIKVLDLCAAPGGKTTLLMSKLNRESYLVSNEYITARASILQENIMKWGTGNVFVTNNEASHFSKLKNHFDLIAVDAPCSGEGLFRKDEAARTEWSENNCSICEERQEKIVQEVWDALKPGGYMFYSTCTFNKEENENMLLKLKNKIGFVSIQVDFPKEWGITSVQAEDIFGYQFYPHKTAGEGFFIAVLQKKQDSQGAHSKSMGLPKEIKEEAARVVIRPELKTILFREEITALTPAMFEDFIKIDKQLNLKYAGTSIGTIIKGKLNPSHALAMSPYLNQDAFEKINLNKQEALMFLSRKEFNIESKTLGWMLICYENTPLGFIKHMGNRWNNYYPMSWRIRMDIDSIEPLS